MKDWLAELVELYEYRVADVMAGRPPRGDRQSFNQLRENLMFADGMDSNLRRRFMDIERTYREFIRGGGSIPTGVRDDKRLEQRHAAAQQAAKALATRLWQQSAEEWLLARLLAARFQPRLLPLRLLATGEENIRRQERYEPPLPLMPLEEALAKSLALPSGIGELRERLLGLMTTATGRQRLRGAVLNVRKVAAERYRPEGRSLQLSQYLFGDPEDTDPKEAERLLSAPGQRSEEELDLLLLVQSERGVDQVLKRWSQQEHLSRTYYRSVEIINQWPENNGELPSDKRLILLPLPPKGAGTPPAAHWDDLQLYLLPAEGNNWQLQVEAPGAPPATVTLRTDLPQQLQAWQVMAGRQRVRLSVQDGFILLRREQAAGPSLGLAAARARLGSYLLQPYNAFAPMRLARAAALTLRGRALAGHDFSPDSARRYLVTAPLALGNLAARGMEALLILSERCPAQEVETKLEQTAQQIGLPTSEGQLLAHLISHAAPELLLSSTSAESAGLSRTGTFTLLSQGGQQHHWDIDVGSLHLTIDRQDAPGGQPRFTASLNGESAPVQEQVILPAEGGVALLAQEAGQLTLAVVPLLKEDPSI